MANRSAAGQEKVFYSCKVFALVGVQSSDLTLLAICRNNHKRGGLIN